MDGVIRIGAVNCGDNRMLCRIKGINSYPSLYVFKTGMVSDKTSSYFGNTEIWKSASLMHYVLLINYFFSFLTIVKLI